MHTANLGVLTLSALSVQAYIEIANMQIIRIIYTCRHMGPSMAQCELEPQALANFYLEPS